ncbi:MAG: hypothetical protein KC493_09335, partial [Bacteriovoracaceae bacterium]|nr:hypothetical protein [Bacteriovoracaceae bacterium]
MKKMLLLILVLFSTSVFAQDGDVADKKEVLIIKAKCTIGGNINIKVRGLETFGTLGTRKLTANVPYFDNCNDVLMGFNQTVNRGLNQVNAKVYSKKWRTRQMSGNRLICRTYQKDTLLVVFPDYPELRFMNTKE